MLERISDSMLCHREPQPHNYLSTNSICDSLSVCPVKMFESKQHVKSIAHQIRCVGPDNVATTNIIGNYCFKT